MHLILIFFFFFKEFFFFFTLEVKRMAFFACLKASDALSLLGWERRL
jgi:hypothetical protein